MRVALDCTPFRRGHAGGYEEYLLNLLDGLAELGAEDLQVDLWVLDSERAHFEGYARCFGIRTMRDGGLYWRVLWQNTVLPWRSRRYAALVCTGNVRPWWAGCPTITVIHDLQYRRFPELWPKAALLHRRLFVPRSARRSSALIALSNSAAAEIEAAFGRRDIAVCGQAVRIDHGDAAGDAPGEDARPYLLVPSTLATHKNLGPLCEALRRAWPNGGLPRFVFIGAWQPEEFPHELPEGCAELLGHVSTAARDSLLAGCEGVVLPSIYEGFGMPYAEAILADRPVIASDLPVAREVLGDAALFIEPPHDADAIESVLRAWAAGQRPVSGAPAREALRRRTDPVEVARRYVEVIRAVVSGR